MARSAEQREGRVEGDDAPRPGDYRAYVSYRLEQTATRARAAASEEYQRACGLDLRQVRILRIVAEEPGLTVSSVVERARFDRTLVSRLISGLVRAGLLLRTVSPADARSFRIEITKAGLAKAQFANALGDRLNEDLLSTLTPEERVAFARSLDKLMEWRPRTGTPRE